MKILIITVAGLSSRFSKSLGYECLKCIYTPDIPESSLLYKMLHQPVRFDKYIIVGGYKYSELEIAVKKMFPEYAHKIVLIENKYYATYGSGYSLYLGLQQAIKYHPNEIVFAEGDLYIDAESFLKIYESELNVVTSNKEAIWANKAVAFYYDVEYKVHYIYDTGHKLLEIKEPFIGIFNSGQIWKFANFDLVRSAYNKVTEEEWKGTNLSFIQKYFWELSKEEYTNIQFKKWINCNTVNDFKMIKE